MDVLVLLSTLQFLTAAPGPGPLHPFSGHQFVTQRFLFCGFSGFQSLTAPLWGAAPPHSVKRDMLVSEPLGSVQHTNTKDGFIRIPGRAASPS